MEPLMDAAWALCRTGILRPGVRGNERVGKPVSQLFCLTTAGRTRFLEADALGLTVAVGEHLVRELNRHGDLFGPIYASRARDAVLAHEGGAHFASCSMSGAAVESILLAFAHAHPTIPNSVIAKYERGNRSALVNAVLAEMKGDDRRKVEARLDLLLHWRDKSAHATPHAYNSETAHLALRDLQALANLVGSKWGEFTSP
jgi:hypothetical protein